MSNRRSFLKQTGLLAGAFSTQSIFNEVHAKDFERTSFNLYSSETEDDFWKMIQDAYTVNPEIINLNNGGVSPAPKSVQLALDEVCNWLWNDTIN